MGRASGKKGKGIGKDIIKSVSLVRIIVLRNHPSTEIPRQGFFGRSIIL
jgi:hypothetical protein